jgi:hypothetical protein
VAALYLLGVVDGGQARAVLPVVQHRQVRREALEALLVEAQTEPRRLGAERGQALARS